MINSIIRFFRRNAGLTQEEMALKLNVDRSLISKYENGLVEPNLSTLIKMSDLFHIEMSTLCLCMELTSYSPGQAKAILLSADSSCKSYFLTASPIAAAYAVGTLPNAAGLSEEDRQLVLRFLDSYHGQHISAGYYDRTPVSS